MCVPGLTIKQFASTADVEALMCSASAQQHAASSHLVLSVYVACKDHTTGEADKPVRFNPCARKCRGLSRAQGHVTVLLASKERGAARSICVFRKSVQSIFRGVHTPGNPVLV